MTANENKKSFLRLGINLTVFVLLILVILFIRSRRGGQEDGSVELLSYSEVADFSFLDQTGEEFLRSDLDGKIWVANFVFTSCAAECPILSGKMAELQTRLEGREDIAFVSFSVDPRTDTPERLATYAKTYSRDGRWVFLTGDIAEISKIIRYSFLLPVAESDRERTSIQLSNFLHSNKFAVVDPAGSIRYHVEGLEADAVDRLKEAIDLITAEAG